MAKVAFRFGCAKQTKNLERYLLHGTHPLLENRRCNGTIIDVLGLIVPLKILPGAGYSGSSKFYPQDLLLFVLAEPYISYLIHTLKLHNMYREI